MGGVYKENAQTKKQKQSKDTSKTNKHTRYLGTLDSLPFKKKWRTLFIVTYFKEKQFPTVLVICCWDWLLNLLSSYLKLLKHMQMMS